MRLIVILFLIVTLPFAAAAQDRPNTILVLDASGSMWGQIDGVAKITIAQEVVTDLLQSFPADENLGLTIYGARTRGDCTDIQTIVEPGTSNRDAIAAAVAAIKPLGKTPMTDAIIAAAQALRYTEDTATVILVSDGVETCNPDPCAAARLLEENGIGFTAHVIGFDVGADTEAVAQMQCIADETGGQFLTAANAAELTAALDTVAAESEPSIFGVTFRATEGDGGRDITAQVAWQMEVAGQINDWAASEALGLDMNPGTYTMTAFWTEKEMQQSVTFTVTNADQTVIAVFPLLLPKATLEAPETAPIGTEVAIAWTGPNEQSDTIQIGTAADGYTYDYTYTSDGSPLMVTMPTTPGTYELRYRLHDDTTIATRVITVTPAEVSLVAPDTAPGGSTVQVGWVGPDGQNDNIQIGAPNDGDIFDYAYVRNSNPVSLTLPWDPGLYEFRYKFQDRETIATRAITITPGTVTLDAPDQAALTSDVSVTWSGPDAPSDTITIGKVGDDGYTDYGYTTEGSPLTIRMPSESGTYELQYRFRDRQVIATRPITVTEVASGLVAPDTAVAGSNVTVGWEGPGGNTDFIGVGKPGDDAYINYTYTRNDNPLTLEMPLEPGTYDIRYYLGGDNTVLTSRPISVTALKVDMTAPAEVVAGATIAVDWTGPNYDLDFIGVGTPGDDAYINYTYTRDGAPTDLQMPVDAGTYEIRYYLSQDNTIAQRIPVTVTSLKVQLVAAASVALSAGTITVGYDGPDYNLDFVGIGMAGGNDYVTYAYTQRGNPLEIDLPDAAGSYEIRYFLGQDNTIVARLPLEVTK